MKFPRKILINHDAKIFNVILRLKTSDSIFLVIEKANVGVIIRVANRKDINYFESCRGVLGYFANTSEPSTTDVGSISSRFGRPRSLPHTNVGRRMIPDSQNGWKSSLRRM